MKAPREVLARDWKRFVPRDKISQDEVRTFLNAWDRTHGIHGPEHGSTAGGRERLDLPISVVKTGGSWRFDPDAGTEEMRRRNTRSATVMAMAFSPMRRNSTAPRAGSDSPYWAADAQGDSSQSFALRLVKPGEGCYGGHCKIPPAQSKDALGGAYDYVIGNRMRAGFALVAWPIRYGDTGSGQLHDQPYVVLYQKDMEPASAAAAKRKGY